MSVEENPPSPGMKELISLAKAQTEMGAMRTYMNTERTLSVWVRTAMGGLVLGIAIDRLGLWMHQVSVGTGLKLNRPDQMTEILGAAFVVYAMMLVVLCSWRFIAFCRVYKKKYEFPAYHRAWLPVTLSAAVFLFGIALLLVIFLIR